MPPAYGSHTSKFGRHKIVSETDAGGSRRRRTRDADGRCVGVNHVLANCLDFIGSAPSGIWSFKSGFEATQKGYFISGHVNRTFALHGERSPVTPRSATNALWFFVQRMSVRPSGTVNGIRADTSPIASLRQHPQIVQECIVFKR